MTAYPTDSNLETVTFGSGCFWCTEAVFQHLRGVKSAVSGYSGGRTLNPTYEQICSGTTGHAEVIQVTYDPRRNLLRRPAASLLAHPRPHHAQPPRPRRRHPIPLGHLLSQRRAARRSPKHTRQQLDKSGTFGAPIVTEITPFEKFYPAEKYHQEYFDLNPNQGYCQVVIRPKVEKFKKEFSDLLETK